LVAGRYWLVRHSRAGSRGARNQRQALTVVPG
jgi:hypothetical protein